MSYWLGAGNAEKARGAVRLGFLMVLSTSLTLCTSLFLARHWLAGIYARNPDVVAMTIPLLAWVALYHCFDALQALTVFFLRCFRVVLMPLLVYCLLLWGGGLLGGYLLAYEGLGPWPAMQSATAFWATSAMALGVTSLIFIGLLMQVMKRDR